MAVMPRCITQIFWQHGQKLSQFIPAVSSTGLTGAESSSVQLCNPFTDTIRGATKKAGGSIKNSKDSHPKYLGSKVTHGQVVFPGRIIMRQRGTQWYPGQNVGLGKDHTIFSKTVGYVQFRTEVRGSSDGGFRKKQVINVTPLNNDYSPQYREKVAAMVAARAAIKAQLSDKVPRQSGVPLSLAGFPQPPAS